MKKMSLILACMLILSSTFAQAETVKTASGFDTGKCTKCHSATPADEVNQFPRLEGQSVKYFISAVNSYKTKARHNYSATSLMSKRVNLDAATVGQLAEFFNKLPAQATITGGDPAVIALGKDIYTNGIPDRNVDSCVMCHGKEGAGKGLNPRLAGQVKYFLVDQLHSYRDGEIDKQEDMKAAAKALTESEIDAVATYLQAL